MAISRLTLLGMLVRGLVFAAALAPSARADEPTADKLGPALAVERRIDRTWLYVDDATAAAPASVIGMTSISYTNVGSNPNRIAAPYKAFAFNTAQPGALISAGGEVGLLPRISILALGQVAAAGEAANPNAGAVAGLRFQLSPSSWHSVRLLTSLGYLREAWAPGEPSGDNGAWIEAAVAGDVQRLKLGLTVHGERVFASGRDKVDVMIRAGVSYRVVGALRAGVEWVGQDIEEVGGDAAEGGARQFVGPTASMQLLQDRLTLVAGPSVGLSDRSPQMLGRFALAYAF